MIYFIQGENGGPIKIGYTQNAVINRITSLQVGYPYKLKVICLIKGYMDLEKRIHNTFVSSRLYGEWFTPHVKILDYISYLHSKKINIKNSAIKTIDAIGGRDDRNSTQGDDRIPPQGRGSLYKIRTT